MTLPSEAGAHSSGSVEFAGLGGPPPPRGQARMAPTVAPTASNVVTARGGGRSTTTSSRAVVICPAINSGFEEALHTYLAVGDARGVTLEGFDGLTYLDRAAQAAHPMGLQDATAAGSNTLTHINDASFWLFKGYFDLSVKDTLKTWGMLELSCSIVGLGMVLLLSIFV